MKRILISSWILLFSLIARADLLEYNATSTARGIGDGYALPFVVRGLLVYDTSNGTFTAIGQYAAQKVFTVSVRTNYQTLQITGPKATTYTLLVNTVTQTNSGKLFINSDLVKGINRTLKTSTNTTYTFPAALSGVRNFQITPQLGAENWLVESTDVFAFNAKRTIADNNAHLTMEQAVGSYTNYLLSLGYHKEN